MKLAYKNKAEIQETFRTSKRFELFYAVFVLSATGRLIRNVRRINIICGADWEANGAAYKLGEYYDDAQIKLKKVA